MNRYRSFLMILFFALWGTLTAFVYAQPREDKKEMNDSIQYTIENCIHQFSPDKIETTQVGYQYRFIDKNLAAGSTLKMTVVGPHKAAHLPHAHTGNEIFFILEGSAELFLNGTWTLVGPHTSFYCPSNIEHGIRNADTTELKYLVIKCSAQNQ